MEGNDGFLANRIERPWKLDAKHGLRAEGLFVDNTRGRANIPEARGARLHTYIGAGSKQTLGSPV